MIDIHCHILPGVDDGAEDLNEALEMAFLAGRDGTKTLIMTPHCNVPDTDTKNFRSDDLTKQFELFRRAVRDAGIELNVLPGAEILATPELPDLLHAGAFQTLADSDYLLVEFFFDEELNFIDDTLAFIRSAGYLPVIAHPERYHAVQKNPLIVERWFREDTVIQLNKDSILGRLGTSAHRAANWILEHGLAHTVASDAHATDRRTPGLAGVRSYIEATSGPLYADILLEENPGRICQNRPMLTAE